MKCAHEHCNLQIPPDRRGNSKYCTNNCYKKAKKIRDKEIYKVVSGRHKIIINNEKMLAFFFELNGLLPLEYFDIKKFNWDRFDSKGQIKGQTVFVIGKYAFAIEKHDEKQYVKIWLP